MFPEHIPGITPDQVPQGAYLLDVRENDEWAAGHAPDAHHLPMSDIPARMGEIPMDDQVVVVCRSGGRSAQVVAYLRANGWDNVVNLEGGMRAWAAAGRPVVNESETPAQII